MFGLRIFGKKQFFTMTALYHIAREFRLYIDFDILTGPLIAREFRLYIDFDILTGPVKISKYIYTLNSRDIYHSTIVYFHVPLAIGLGCKDFTEYMLYHLFVMHVHLFQPH